jgi:ferredoxin--NADP+ reductase
MGDWLQGRITQKRRWTERLYSLRIDAPIKRFTPGQFIRIALDIDGERVARPLFLRQSARRAGSGDRLQHRRERPPHHCTARGRRRRYAPGGTQRWRLLHARRSARRTAAMDARHGHRPRRVTAPARNHKRLATLRTTAPGAHAELTYRERIEEIRSTHPDHFDYIPIMSRESCDFALAGRIPAAIVDGRLEQRAGLRFEPEQSQVMLCGNQDMIRDTMQVLSERGLRRNRRRTPGHITTENTGRPARIPKRPIRAG